MSVLIIYRSETRLSNNQLLFALYFQAANEVVDSLAPVFFFWFKSKNDFIFTARKTKSVSDTEFQFDKYADDEPKLYESRENLIAGMQIIFTVFERFGLTLPCGKERRQVQDRSYVPLATRGEIR